MSLRNASSCHKESHAGKGITSQQPGRLVGWSVGRSDRASCARQEAAESAALPSCYIAGMPTTISVSRHFLLLRSETGLQQGSG